MVRKIYDKILLLIFLISGTVLSDTITLSDGKRISGRILNSTKSYIAMVTDDYQTIQIPHDRITSINFSWADIVHLSSGEKIECKIVNRIMPNLIIVTTAGLQEIPSENIKMFFYHSIRGLEVPALPTTGADFKNQKEFFVL